MIQLENVTIATGDKTIIQNASLSVDAGQKAALFGKSGSGKSTILLSLMGARPPVSGTIRLNGLVVSPSTIREVRQKVSYISQEPVLGTQLVREALLLPFTFRARTAPCPSDEEVTEILEKLQLPISILDSEVSVISGGEKQRIAIARELLQKKDIFILDEVTSALDRESKSAVMRLFRNSGFTVLSVSHDPDWMAVCDTYYHVDGGTVEKVHDFRPFMGEMT